MFDLGKFLKSILVLWGEIWVWIRVFNPLHVVFFAFPDTGEEVRGVSVESEEGSTSFGPI